MGVKDYDYLYYLYLLRNHFANHFVANGSFFYLFHQCCIVFMASCRYSRCILCNYYMLCLVNSSPPGQNGRHFADDNFKHILMNEKFCISIRISLNVIPNGLIDNESALIQVMAWQAKQATTHYLTHC